MSIRLVLGTAASLVTLGLVGALVSTLAMAETPRELELPPSLLQYAAAPVAAPAPATEAPTVNGAPAVSPAWVAKVSDQAGIPAPAVRAYAVAQMRVADQCNIGWTTLAGIGWIESQHGTMGGRTLFEDGHSDTAVIGPALDGAGGYAGIPASADSATLHTDTRWDHAVGPMQFITSTWMDWASDGDGDGISDAYDIDDAAYASARYLCASGADFTSGPGWARAIYSYNHSQAYVEQVNSAASAYAQRTAR